MASVKSPSKYLSRKFLADLQKNNYISNGGEGSEYCDGEVDLLLSEKDDAILEYNASDEAWEAYYAEQYDESDFAYDDDDDDEIEEKKEEEVKEKQAQVIQLDQYRKAMIPQHHRDSRVTFQLVIRSPNERQDTKTSQAYRVAERQRSINRYTCRKWPSEARGQDVGAITNRTGRRPKCAYQEPEEAIFWQPNKKYA